MAVGDFAHVLRDAEFAEPDLCFIQVYDGHRARKVRKTPSWPRSWANFSLL